VEIVVAVLLLGLLGTGLLAMTSGAALSAGNRQRQSDIQTVLAAAADSLSGIAPVACSTATTAYQDTARARLTALGLGGGWTTAVLTVTKVQSWNASAGSWDSACASDSAVHKVTIKVTPPSAASQARSLDVLTGAGTASVPIGAPWYFGTEWSVITNGNATIGGTQVYGGLAVGGDLSFTGSGPIAANSQGSFAPVFGAVTNVGLLVNGKVNLTAGTLYVNQSASVIIGNMSGQKYLPSGGAGCIVPSLWVMCIDPKITLQGTGNAVTGQPFDFTAAFNAYLKSSAAMAALPGSCANAVPVQLLDQNGVGPWSGSGNFQLKLTPGKTNVWNMTETQLQGWGASNNNGADRPSATTALIINVTSADHAVTFAAPGWIQNTEAKYVLWNFPDATSVTFTNALWGTLFAPQASFTMNADVRGVVVAASLNGVTGVADWSQRPVIDIQCPRSV
jgi:choice-of-anchor A domain-containing protein